MQDSYGAIPTSHFTTSHIPPVFLLQKYLQGYAALATLVWKVSSLLRFSPGMPETIAFLTIKHMIQDQSVNKPTRLSSNLRSALPISDIGLKYSFAIHCCLVYAVLSFCLSLNFFPTKTHNTGLFKGRFLFASCLLLRQMFQGMIEDINICTLEGGKKERCPGV